jgi:hypothetical protein
VTGGGLRLRLLRVLARPVNWLIGARNAVVDRHASRVAEQSAAAVTEQTVPSARIAPEHRPYVVYFDGGDKRRFADFDEAARFYLLYSGYGLVNEDRQTDGGNYAGLTDEQRGELGL